MRTDAVVGGADVDARRPRCAASTTSEADHLRGSTFGGRPWNDAAQASQARATTASSRDPAITSGRRRRGAARRSARPGRARDDAHRSILASLGCARHAPADARPRPPRRRVEQGRGDARRSTSPRASTSTSSPAPAASAARSSTPRWTGPTSLANITEIRRQEMERARDILGVRQDWLGLRRLRLARGRPAAAAARGLLRAGAARGGGRARWSG